MVFEYAATPNFEKHAGFLIAIFEKLILSCFYCVEKIALTFQMYSAQNMLKMCS